MDERKWIERILAGDTQSFSCLVAKYEKMAYTIALRILENREEAEEAVQDAFVKMYRALSDFHFDSKFSTWFYTSVRMFSLSSSRISIVCVFVLFSLLCVRQAFPQPVAACRAFFAASFTRGFSAGSSPHFCSRRALRPPTSFR